MAENAQAEPAAGGSRKLIIITAVLVLVLLGGGGAAALMLMQAPAPGDAEAGAGDTAAAGEQAPPAERHYFSLAPAFVVNFSDPSSRARFLKVELDAVAHEEEDLELVSKHMPAIRNAVVLLLSRQRYEGLLEHEGKEALRASVRETIRGVLEASAGEPIVEDVYFTSFVMQ